MATGAIRHDVELPWWPNGIAATTDGTAALVAGVGGVVRIDLATGAVDARIDLPEVSWYTEVQATVAPSPDGRHVAVARGPRIEILDTGDLHQVQTWQAGQYDDVLALQWLDDGRALAFGGKLGRLEIRAFPDGQTLVAPRQVFPGFVLDIAVNPNGSLLALHGTDGEVVLWDVAAAEPVGEPLVPDPGNAWGWVRFTPDGAALEALYDSKRAYTYPIDTETLVTRACRARRQGAHRRGVVLDARRPAPATPLRPTDRAGSGATRQLRLFPRPTRLTCQPQTGGKRRAGVVLSPRGLTGSDASSRHGVNGQSGVDVIVVTDPVSSAVRRPECSLQPVAAGHRHLAGRGVGHRVLQLHASEMQFPESPNSDRLEAPHRRSPGAPST